jgi:hypothetical protein
MGVAKPARPVKHHSLTTNTHPFTPKAHPLPKRPPRRMGVAKPARPVKHHSLTTNTRPFTPKDRRFPSAASPPSG